ncbi:YeiH family protein [Celerinatantimonas yamalensis]|uniref:YeiH family protein n=1 Tax=Celerinatantimonas yamalensis TaxID=559956 RepID=A0ABW9G8Q5_9GAMM
MKRFLPGIILALVTALIGSVLSHYVSEWVALSPLMVGLILGIIIANSPLERHLQPTAPGLGFSQSRLLRLGVMLFGLHITVSQLVAIGWPGIGLAAVMVTSVLTVGYFLGTRVFKLPPELALLTAAGTGICGAAAVMAVDPVIKPKDEYVVVAVATVVIFGTLAMFGYPLLFPFLHMSQDAFAALAGSTTHEVAQVVVIGESISPQAANVAVIVKLARVMLLAPALLIISWLWQRRQQAQANGEQVTRGKITIPWFAFGFIAVVLINGYLPISHALRAGLLQFDTLVLAMAMSALGFNTRLKNIHASSAKAILLALCLFVMMVAISSTLIHFFWPATL